MSLIENPLMLPASPPAGDSAAKAPLAVDLHLVADIVLRVVTALVFGAFAVAAISHWLATPSRLTLLLLVVANCFTTGLSLIVRTPRRRDWRPIAMLCALGGTYGCIAYNFKTGIEIVPQSIGVMLQMSGIAWQLFAKVSLRRSFGVLPANRGVVSRGAYRFIRHPMYLGYFVTDLGFLLTNFTVYNLCVLAVQMSCQVGRILQEERMLSGDEHYLNYRNQVRFRLIPTLF
jgi:protein-S-isoprenylcysteine O-methyltransferase Ste14